MNDIDKIGKKAALLLSQIAGAKNSMKMTRSANKERVEKLRPLLQQVWDALDNNQPVMGCATKQEWVEENSTTTLRNCQYVLKGGNTNRPDAKRFASKFLSRCADAKKKLTDIQSQIDAPVKDGEVRDGKVLFGQINPAIEPVFREFLALISPDGFEVLKADRGWFMQEKEQPAPITHIRFSPRKAWCQTRFVNRKIKGLVFAKNDEVTCPDCVKMHEESKTPKRLETDETVCTETCLTCGNQRTDDGSNALVTIPVSPGAQNAARLHCLKCGTKASVYNRKKFGSKPVGWKPDAPVEKSKKTVSPTLNKKELKAYETLKAKLDKLFRKFLNGEISADEWRVEFKLIDDENTGREVFRTRHSRYVAWMKEGKGRMEAAIAEEAKHQSTEGMSESAKALDETVETAEVPELTWGQKVCIIGSPENLQWRADIKRRREYPYIDPNEADDESKDCETEEDSEGEVL